jgi:glycosyltransferase involved in cell wall biosynthesis
MHISLAIPFHSRVDLLRKTLESVLLQSDPEWTCLVADDSVAGEAESLVRGLADERIRFAHHTQSRGMADNWNYCLAHAGGDWVTLLHADDELCPNYVALVKSMAARHPTAGAVYCQSEIIDEASNTLFSFPDYVKKWIDPSRGRELRVCGDAGAAALLRGNFIMCPTLSYSREVAEGSRFAERFRMVHDLDFTLRLLEAGREIFGSAEVGYRYRRHANNATVAMTESLERFHEECLLYDEFSARAQARGWPLSAVVAKRKRIIQLHLGFRVLEDLARWRFSGAGRKAQLLWSLLVPD